MLTIAVSTERRVGAVGAVVTWFGAFGAVVVSFRASFGRVTELIATVAAERVRDVFSSFKASVEEVNMGRVRRLAKGEEQCTAVAKFANFLYTNGGKLFGYLVNVDVDKF